MRRNYDRTTQDPRSLLHELYSNTSTYAPPVTATSSPILPNVTRPDFSTTPIVTTANLTSLLNRSVNRVNEHSIAPTTSPRSSVLYNRILSPAVSQNLTATITPVLLPKTATAPAVSQPQLFAGKLKLNVIWEKNINLNLTTK